MSTRVIRAEFSDFDAFRETLLGWDHEGTQLSPGKLCLRYDRLIFDNLSIGRITLNRRIVERMDVQPRHFRFVVCFKPQVLCGIPVPAGSLVLFAPGRNYRSVLVGDACLFEMTVPAALLHAVGLSLWDGCPRQLAPERSIIPLTDLNMRAFHAIAENPFFQTRLEVDRGTGQRWASAIRDRALGLLTAILRQHEFGGEIKPQKAMSGWGLAARALDHIDRHRYEHVSVSDLSAALGYSARALQFAFQDMLGVSPHQYLLFRRLHLARSALLSGEAGGVTRIAAEHHFFHFGRFSQYYQDLFGELPSETLQRARTLQRPLEESGVPRYAALS